MTDGLLALLIGTVLLWVVWSERPWVRRELPRGRWWRPPGSIEELSPGRPLNAVIGTVLGLAAVVYGVVELVG